MTSTWVSVAVVVLLILLEALFVAAEIALVSLRESQVSSLAERGRRGATVARLVRNPNRFLAAVQIGVTLTSLLSSAYGAATLTERAAHGLRSAGVGDRWAGATGFVVVFLAISYVTLVIGELVPKRLALQRTEGVAQLVAGPLDVIATVVRPVIWLLSRSTDLVVRLLGGNPDTAREGISEDELRDIVATQESLTPDERQLIDDVFAAGERQVREVMIPRTEVAFLDGSLPLAVGVEQVSGQPHSRYPVFRGSQDDVVGFVHVRDLLAPVRARSGATVADLVREAKLLPGSKRVLPALSEMRREGHHLAIVVDEYGGTAGIVTLEDLIEEVIGEIRDEYDPQSAASRLLLGGDIEVGGLLNLDEFAEQTGIALPEGPYETVAGYVMALLGHVPDLGEAVEVEGHRLSVTEMDGRRVARIRVTPLPGPLLADARGEAGERQAG